MVDGSGNIGINISGTSPSRTLTVSGTTWTGALELERVPGAAVPISVSTGAGTETDPEVGTLDSGKWCVTDGSTVNCTEDEPSGSDNLGNHTAEEALHMAGFDIQAARLITATTVSATNISGTILHVGGNAGIGTDTPNTTLQVSGSIQISDADGDGSGCSTADDVGKFRFNATTNKFQLCRP